jgi:uracil phosphoribosyltransferase
MPGSVYVSRHPVVLHKLALLREHTTPPPQFRALVHDLTQLLCLEALADLTTEPVVVTTPLGPCPAQRIRERIGVLPILRAGLGMANAILDLLPDARVWHLGLYRDHETLLPVIYYNKLPSPPDLDFALVVDPMLATGGSAVAALDLFKNHGGVARIKFLGILATPEGVTALQKAHPDVDIHLAALDSHLSDKGYIVPGLGDAGDRQFAT